MSAHERFHLKDIDQVRALDKRLGLQLPLDEDLACLGEPLEIANLRVANRFAVHPMEGFDADADGAPGELSFRRYRRYAAGGAGLIWFEATAVLHAARSNPGQFCLHERSVGRFRELVEMTRRTAREEAGHEIVLVLQLTHSGRYSKPTGLPAPIIAHHSPILDPRHNLPDDYPLVTDDYLDRLQDRFVAAARLAAEAGFDGVDVKACHRYLVSELLASHTRAGKYGGSFENRTRLLRETLDRIASEVPDVFITTRMNAYDAIAYPYGWGVAREDHCVPDLADPLHLARDLSRAGVPVLNVSIGNPYFNPHYGRPFDFPVAGGSAPPEHPLEGIARFVSIVREIQREIPRVPVIGGGYTWLRQFMPNLGAGVIRTRSAALIGQGRGSFAYPDSVRDILEKGAMDPGKCCVACSGCTQIMRDGGQTGCVVRDSEVYGPQYRLARRFAVDRLRAEARRCRDCDIPTCSAGCPARVEVPEFLKAFADGDIPGAYSILRRHNVLPEMCGYVCPAAEQCEGGCVESIFCERPLPIRDIQLVVCRTARLQGIIALELPQAATGKSVTIAGAGPAGLACAIRLLADGHRVTLLERATVLGGTPDEIIPATRYGNAKAEVDAILAPAIGAGRLELRLGTSFGAELSLADLRADSDAVFVALGLSESVSLGAGAGVLDALDFLKQAKAGTRPDLPPRVAVLGGGNTAMDAATTAIRLGARDVFVLYRRSFTEMPAWPEERDAFLRAGGHLIILTQAIGYETDASGRCVGVRTVRTTPGEPDASGRRKPVPVEHSASRYDVDLVIEAFGQHVAPAIRDALAGVTFNARGLIETLPDATATSVPGVFAGGDIVNGGTTAVRGVAEGMRAADEITQYLKA